jgi:hypothetical protein
MEIRVEFVGDPADTGFMDKITRAFQLMGAGSMTMQAAVPAGSKVEVTAPGGEASSRHGGEVSSRHGEPEVAEQEAPKRRGRPAKAEAKPNGLDANGEYIVSDADLLLKVKTFRDDHPGLNSDVKSLLDRYHASTISQIAPEQRNDFLRDMQDLLAFS